MPPNALITGATGFIGRHLARELVRRGWQVHALLRTQAILPAGFPAEVRRHDYDGSTDNVAEAVARSRPDVVFHLASLYLSQHRPDQVAEVIAANVLLGAQLAEAMTNFGHLALVNAGTGWQHYQQRNYDPVNLYAATKQAFEDIVEYYVQARNLRVETLMLFDTYGPDDPRPKILNLLFQAAHGQVPLDMSPGEQQLDLVYIDDAVSAFVEAGERLRRGVGRGHERFVVSSRKRVTLRELVRLAEEVMQVPIPVRWGARPYREREVMVPWEGEREGCLPGWECRVPLADGLAKTLASLQGQVGCRAAVSATAPS
jgi:nucleoside-diphosphate-sugar epimerase